MSNTALSIYSYISSLNSMCQLYYLDHLIESNSPNWEVDVTLFLETGFVRLSNLAKVT